MSPESLQTYLYDHIPLSRAMQVQVAAVEPENVTLSAPLAPNINHQETVFGGSACTLAILSAWSLLHVRMQHATVPAKLVIHRNRMQYDKPMSDGFSAHARLAQPQAWTAFLQLLERKGKARIEIHAELRCLDQPAGRFEGEFVAIASTYTGRS